MTFEESQKIIKEYLESNQNIINKDQCKSLNEILELVYGDIKALNESGNFQDNNVTLVFREVLDTVVGISQIVLTSHLTNSFSTFILAFSELIFNWNNNTYKDSTILVLVKFMTNIIESRNDTLKIIENIKITSDRLQIISNWSPAAFDIAIAYVDEQLKINEEQKEVI